MATKIEWTATRAPDGTWHAGYTFNPWWGCQKISPACRNCYAAGIAHRFGHEVWGALAPRRYQSSKYWRQPLSWNRKAEQLGVRLRVFCGSMCDWLEGRADLQFQRQCLFKLIDQTPNLDWLLLSKRPENLERHLPTAWQDGCPHNVWLGTTAESQKFADRRIPHLVRFKATVHFVSAEPLLGPLSLAEYPVDWVIVGSESGHGARKTQDRWVADLRDECAALDRSFFLKQLQAPNKTPGRVVSLPVFEGQQHVGQPLVRA